MIKRALANRGGSLMAAIPLVAVLQSSKWQILRKSSCTAKSEITVYQYKICPFCHRVKAMLDYLELEYKVVEVNPLTKSELAFSKQYKKVPIVDFGGILKADSGIIIDHIKTTVLNDPKNDLSNFFSEDR